MGLDITYYSNIREVVDSDPDDDDYPWSSAIYTHDLGFYYQLGSLKLLTPYESTPESEIGHISIGYSSYNQWRRELSILAGYESDKHVWSDTFFNPHVKYETLRKRKLKNLKNENCKIKEVKPFYELINFSDCEGVIGPEVSKKLYQDFVNFENKIRNCNMDSYFNNKYKEFKEAFRVASKNGAVSFH